MCGIAGFCRLDGKHVSGRGELADAIACLGHRGPDDDGLWVSDGVGLGHRRLSILDVSTGGHQPMESASGRFVMVFNGEVYNFRDIHHDLEVRGRRFHSSGDTEVILAAFEEWGVEAAVRQFIGMFAIAL